jgi:multiple sugar transport system permease protein
VRSGHVKVKWFLGRAAIYTLAALVVFVCVAPFAWLVISSISDEKDLYVRPRDHWVPKHITFARLNALLTGGERTSLRALGPSMQRVANEFLYAFRNSLVVSVATTTVCLVVGALAAFAYARFKFRGRQTLFFLTISTRMLPPISIAIPLYILISQMRLMDTPYALILTYNYFLLPVVIWVMANYFETIPRDMEEAALIDGCSPMGAFLRVILPVASPVIISTALIGFLMAWDEFFFALIFTQTTASKTLPKAISEFSTQFGGMDYGLVSAGGVIVSVVPVLIAFVLQRYIVVGLTSGSVKG